MAGDGALDRDGALGLAGSFDVGQTVCLSNLCQVMDPDPRVLHPDWLHEKFREKDD
jgi:hypothetical protein